MQKLTAIVLLSVFLISGAYASSTHNTKELESTESQYITYIQSVLRDALTLSEKTTSISLPQDVSTLVQIIIAPNGALANCTIIKSSGYRSFDQLVLQTIVKAVPTFRPTPTGKEIGINISFKHNSDFTLRHSNASSGHSKDNLAY